MQTFINECFKFNRITIALSEAKITENIFSHR